MGKLVVLSRERKQGQVNQADNSFASASIIPRAQTTVKQDFVVATF